MASCIWETSRRGSTASATGNRKNTPALLALYMCAVGTTRGSTATIPKVKSMVTNVSVTVVCSEELDKMALLLSKNRKLWKRPNQKREKRKKKQNVWKSSCTMLNYKKTPNDNICKKKLNVNKKENVKKNKWEAKKLAQWKKELVAVKQVAQSKYAMRVTVDDVGDQTVAAMEVPDFLQKRNGSLGFYYSAIDEGLRSITCTVPNEMNPKFNGALPDQILMLKMACMQMHYLLTLFFPMIGDAEVVMAAVNLAVLRHFFCCTNVLYT